MKMEVQATQRDIDKYLRCFLKHDFLPDLESKIFRKYLQKYVGLLQWGSSRPNVYLLTCYNKKSKNDNFMIKILGNERLREDSSFINAMMRRIPYDPDAMIIIDVYERYKAIKKYLSPYKFNVDIPEEIKNNERLFKLGNF